MNVEEITSLVVAARAGDMDSYRRIVARFQDMAYGYAYAILGDFHLAEDAAQEAFLEAYHCLGKLRDPSAFPAWFRRIVHYRCSRMIWGKRLPLTPLDDAAGVADTRDSPSQVAEDRETERNVTEAIRSLPEPQRRATTFFYINGYAVQEIAGFLEVPVNTVKSRLHAARQRLMERMMGMVKQTFVEHKLPDAFAGRVIQDVPVLGRDRTGNTTYIAAVSAGFSVTETPFDYDTLMAYSGLAFRLRYVRQKDGRGWCRVGPVGQFEEEVDAICRATGWKQSWVQDRDREEMKRRIVQAIDSGNCPTAYIHGDNGVIYGYEDGGETLLVRCYDMGEGFHRMTLQQMLELPGGGHGPFFMDRAQEPMSRRDALLGGLRLGLINWCRGREPGEKWQSWRPAGVWEYCFGEAAYSVWLDDLRNVGNLGAGEREELYKSHTWAAYVLYDARLAGSQFLRANAELLGMANRERLVKAAALYETLGRSIQRLREQGKAFCGGVGDEPSGVSGWTDGVRQREIEVLTEACKLDSDTMHLLEKSVASDGQS